MFYQRLFQAGKSAFQHSGPNFTRSTARLFSTNTKRANVSSFSASTKLFYLTTGIIAGYGAVQFTTQKISLDANKSLKGKIDPNAQLTITSEDGEEFVKPPTDSPPFPKTIKLFDEKAKGPIEYDLLGVGVRTVSFLSFHVYALGIYIASEDKQLARSILKSAMNQYPSQDFETVLRDVEAGPKVIAHLLSHGVRLDLRIVPVRNTDFGHLRDGFVRGILNHPYYKQMSTNPAIPKDDPAYITMMENIGKGINDFKVAFSRKLSVPKYNILHLRRENDGSLDICYYKGKSEADAERVHLGSVAEPHVSTILFLHYLTGKSPASETARTTVVQGLKNL